VNFVDIWITIEAADLCTWTYAGERKQLQTEQAITVFLFLTENHQQLTMGGSSETAAPGGISPPAAQVSRRCYSIVSLEDSPVERRSKEAKFGNDEMWATFTSEAATDSCNTVDQNRQGREGLQIRHNPAGRQSNSLTSKF
jgi:hypothetical protein